ncbi:MAG: TolC family protein, partial [Elusimicrobia bacterium]|nr:TolC family protein [Candidatus Obscuribacterium magneticum]
NIWDSGATYKGWRSFEALAVAKQEEFRARKQQILLATRLSYFNVQLALEKVRLLADSLQLSQAQYRDIETRLRAGASSRLDAYSAHQQVLVYLLQFRQARSDLASSLRDLFALTGQNKDVDVSLPLYAEDKEIYQDYEPATVFLSMDPLENSFGAIKPVDFNKDNSAAKNPQTLAMNQMAQASRLAAESASSAHWPKIQLMAKTSWDYPNGPVLERFHQNTVGVAATLPLFEAGKITHDVAEKNAQADANERRRDQIQSDIMRDWQKSSDQLKGFIAQREINKKSVFETEELAKLTYTSYKNGRSSLLEVQSTNLRALEAKVQTVRTEVQILMQFAIMASLSGEEVAK